MIAGVPAAGTARVTNEMKDLKQIVKGYARKFPEYAKYAGYVKVSSLKSHIPNQRTTKKTRENSQHFTLSTPPVTPSRPSVPPGLGTTNFPTPEPRVPSRQEERMFAPRNLANAQDNMLYLFGRELEVVSPLEEVYNECAPAREDHPQKAGAQADADDSVAGSSKAQSKPRSWGFV